MVRARHLLSVVALLTLLALTAGAVAARDTNKPDKPGKPGQPPKAARITWSVPAVVQQLPGGGQATVEVSFTSSADLEQVTLRLPHALGQVVTAEPASWDKVAANTPVTVRLNINVPAKMTRGALGGMVQVRAGQRAVGRPLPVRVVLRSRDGGADDGQPRPEPTPAPKAKQH